jgi:2',3'-cyclic-nucleotide 2'-phosphodiesterase (5'-nucleotidase family)
MLALVACAPARLQRSPETIDLVVVTTTDVHGRLRAWDYYANEAEAVRGLSRAATIVDSVRAANPGRVILLDAGDLLQGNPLAYVAARVSSDRTSPIVAAMNAMQYDAAAIGNHEYNYGVPYFDSVVRQAKFPFLSANTYRIAPAGIHAYRPWTIIERAGVKVGIVGATTPGVAVWDAENIRGRLRFGEIVPAVRQAVQEARAAGADLILVTVHSGLDGPSSYDTVTTGVPAENVAGRIAADVPGIDLVLYGHSHRESRGTTIEQTLLIQPKNWATSVAIAHLVVSRLGPPSKESCGGCGAWTVSAKRSDLVQAAGHAESPTVLAATDAAHRETVAYVTTPVGTTTERWSTDSARVKDTPLIDFILETERKATGADLASTAAFSTDLVINPGPIAIAQVAQLYPYDNTLRAVRITGKQLRDYLEFSARYWRTPASATGPLVADPAIPGYNFDIVSGVDYVIDVSRPIGSRITRLDYKGVGVRDGDSFTMALNNYRQTGGGGYAMLSGAPVVYDKQQEIRQLLIDEVKRRGVLRQADYFTPNWGLVRGAATATAPTAAAVQPPFPAGTRVLRIIGTNDFHGALEPRTDAGGVRRGGAAYVAAAIDRARRECAPACETLLLDGGDIFQGTPASNLAFGRPVVDYYNRMGYAAAALGNHEFDWGVDTLRARMRQAKFGILGANVRNTDGRDVTWIRNDTIVARGRTRIGIIGVSTVSTPRQTRAGNVVGLRFDDPAPIIDSIGPALRKRGADLVVVVAHAGGSCGSEPPVCNGEIIDFARKLKTRVDAIVSGHSHTLLNTVVNSIPIVQARSTGRAIDVLDIPLGAAASVAPRRDVREIASDTIRPLASIDSIVQRAVARVAPLVSRHVASIPATLARQGPQYPLGNLIADAQRWAGKGDIAIMNNGGIRTELRAGQATYGSLFEIQPFGNTLYSLTMTGAQLRGLIEGMLGKSPVNDHVSGLTISFDPSKPVGSRIVSVTMADGAPLSDSASYNVILNDFLATGGEGYNAAGRATASRPLGIDDLDALIDYLQTLPAPIAAPTEIRIAPIAR